MTSMTDHWDVIEGVLEDERDRHIISGGLAANRKETDAALAFVREQRAQVQPQPDWSKAPAWAQWWTVDADDNVAWFQNRPFCIASGWVNSGGMTQMYNTMLPYHLPLGIDWRTTLQQRPQPKEGAA
jgi:hypothetical protein